MKMQTTQQTETSGEKGKSNIVLIAILIVIGLVGFLFLVKVLTDGMQKTYEEKQTNVQAEHFVNGETFICQSSVFKGANSYLVSKSSGWEIYGSKYFKKEDILIQRAYCTKASVKK